MKAIIKIQVFILLIAVIEGCRPDGFWEIPFKSVSVSEPVFAGTLHYSNVPEIKQRTIKSIGLVDTALLVIDEFEDPFLNFYGLSNLRYLGNYGKAGTGTGKLKTPKYDNQYSVENGRTFFFLHDAGNFVLSKVDLKSALTDSNYVPKFRVPVPPSLILRHVSLYLTKDSMLTGNYRGTENEDKGRAGRFFAYDLRTRKMNWVKYFPAVKQAVSSVQKPYYYYSHCAFNDEKQVMASAMYLFKEVDFINITSKKNTSVRFLNETGPTPYADDYRPNGETNIFFYQSFGGKKNFYTLCLNGKNKSLFDNTSTASLYVFDWDGSLKAIVKLDQPRLGNFVVDEVNKRMYAVNFNKLPGSTTVISYNLSSLKIF